MLERPGFDYLWVAVLVAIHIAVVWVWSVGDVLTWNGVERRVVLYRTAAATASLILTVALAGIALYVGGGGRRLAWFRKYAGRTGLQLWTCVVTALLWMVLVSLVAIAIDGAGAASHVRWAFEGAALLAVWRVVRAYVLYKDQLIGSLADTREEDRRSRRAA